MAQILLDDPDPVFRAVVEDRLRVAGHDVEVAREATGLVDQVAAAGSDLLILGLRGAAPADLEVLEALGNRPETRAVPVLVLSERNDSTSRVAALRAGAADYLAKPCDLEELELRCDRLVGSRIAGELALQGEMSEHPLWELLQYVGHARRTGELALSSRAGSGRVRLHEGRVVYAAWEGLEGREALLAILGLKEGRFRLVPGSPAGPAAEILDVPEQLMRAAWLEDELEARREIRPETGAPLRRTDRAFDETRIPDGLADLPFPEVLGRVEERPGVRTWDLLQASKAAPQRIRLAVVVLVELGLLGVDEPHSGDFPTTRELTSSLILELAVDDYLAAARRAGIGTSALPILVAAEPWAWPELLRLFEGAPAPSQRDPVRRLLRELGDERRHGTLALPGEMGKLVLHVRELSRLQETEAAELVTVCAGILVWLDDGRHAGRIAEWIDRRGTATARGVVIADQPAVYHRAKHLVRRDPRWRVSAHPPRSLLGIFRLLQPEAGEPRAGRPPSDPRPGSGSA